jgi:hypothetical protein
MRSERRAAYLVWISIVGMSGVGLVAMMTSTLSYMLRGNRVDSEILMWFFYAIVIGGLFGALSTPFLVFGLKNKPLNHSVPFVYGPGLVGAVAPPCIDAELVIISLPIALIMVCGLCIVGYFSLPSLPAWFGYPNACRQCGYSRTGLPADRACPECGENHFHQE